MREVSREFVEVWSLGFCRPVPLASERVTIGREESSAVALPDDESASGLHAILQRYPLGWAIRDLGSIGGTFVNGQRVVGERALRAGDEILIGHSRIVLRGSAVSESTGGTVTAEPSPQLTRRENDVLVALCRPLLHDSPFAPPATVADVAASMRVSAGAVKAHLSHLYDKFGLFETGRDRRAELAREAVNRRAVDVGDIGSGRTRPI